MRQYYIKKRITLQSFRWKISIHFNINSLVVQEFSLKCIFTVLRDSPVGHVPQSSRGWKQMFKLVKSLTATCMTYSKFSTGLCVLLDWY